MSEVPLYLNAVSARIDSYHHMQENSQNHNPPVLEGHDRVINLEIAKLHRLAVMNPEIALIG